jgi:hypothetical protein
VIIEVVNLDISWVNKFWQGWPLPLPVAEHRQYVKHNQRSDQKSHEIVVRAGNIEKSDDKSDDFHSDQVDKKYIVQSGIRLLLFYLELYDCQLKQQYNGIDALPASTLQQILIPVLQIVAASVDVMDKQSNAA